MTVHSDPLVDDYLRRLSAAASTLPAHRREELMSEIHDHLQEGLSRIPAGDEPAVRNLLERLGPPEEIVSAAIDDVPSGQLVASYGEINGFAVASLLLGILWFAGIGSVLALVFGYRARHEIKNSGRRQRGSGLAIAGIILGWIGLAILLVAVVAGLAVVAGSSSGSSSGSGGSLLPVPSP
jgi:hypothetical protein